MQVQISQPDQKFYIRAYEAGQICVNETCYEKPIFLFEAELNQALLPAHFEELTIEHMQAMAELEPELVLLGTGFKQKFIEHHLLVPFVKKQIGVEVMNTLSAARTFNLLAEEGRKVLGAFFL